MESIEEKNKRNRAIESQIIDRLILGPKVVCIDGPKICIDDIRIHSHLQPILDIAESLHGAIGRTIENVVWMNIPDRDCNPDGGIGFFRIYFK